MRRAPTGLVIYDSGLVDPGDGPHDFELRGLPFTQASAEHLKKTVVANIVALGALIAVGGVLPPEKVEEAVVRRVPERFRELNVVAYQLGLGLASEAGTDRHAQHRANLGHVSRTGALISHGSSRTSGQEALCAGWSADSAVDVRVDRADAQNAAATIGLPVVVKAQVRTGGRGKAGGVRLCDTMAEVAGRRPTC